MKVSAKSACVKAAPLFNATEVDAVFGSLAIAGKAKTIEEMKAAVAAEARRRAMR